LAGCVTQEQMAGILASQRPPSEEVRRALVNDARDRLRDPYSVRDAEISSVMDAPGGDLQFVCVKMNAKNELGAYVGRTASSRRLVANRVVSTNPDAPICSMSAVRWYPFKELENLKNL